jgi:hypothetical protein
LDGEREGMVMGWMQWGGDAVGLGEEREGMVLGWVGRGKGWCWVGWGEGRDGVGLGGEGEGMVMGWVGWGGVGRGW